MDRRREDGTYFFEPERWYPAGPNIRMFEILKEKVGANTLRQAGTQRPGKTRSFRRISIRFRKAWPASTWPIISITARTGKPLMNPETGEMIDVIGHYRLEEVPGKNEARIVSDTPYPSEFDEGIVAAMARRFEPGARVTLDESQPSRLNGGDTCTYLVRW